MCSSYWTLFGGAIPIFPNLCSKLIADPYYSSFFVKVLPYRLKLLVLFYRDSLMAAFLYFLLVFLKLHLQYYGPKIRCNSEVITHPDKLETQSVLEVSVGSDCFTFVIFFKQILLSKKSV